MKDILLMDGYVNNTIALFAWTVILCIVYALMIKSVNLLLKRVNQEFGIVAVSKRLINGNM